MDTTSTRDKRKQQLTAAYKKSKAAALNAQLVLAIIRRDYEGGIKLLNSFQNKGYVASYLIHLLYQGRGERSVYHDGPGDGGCDFYTLTETGECHVFGQVKNVSKPVELDACQKYMVKPKAHSNPVVAKATLIRLVSFSGFTFTADDLLRGVMDGKKPVNVPFVELIGPKEIKALVDGYQDEPDVQPLSLRPHSQPAALKAELHLRDGKVVHYTAPTGVGKSYAAMAIITRMKLKRVLVLVSRATQEIGFQSALNGYPGVELTFVNYRSAHTWTLDGYDGVILDEAHSAYAEQSIEHVKALISCAKERNVPCLLLTATPYRMDGQSSITLADVEVEVCTLAAALGPILKEPVYHLVLSNKEQLKAEILGATEDELIRFKEINDELLDKAQASRVLFKPGTRAIIFVPEVGDMLTIMQDLMKLAPDNVFPTVAYHTSLNHDIGNQRGIDLLNGNVPLDDNEIIWVFSKDTLIEGVHFNHINTVALFRKTGSYRIAMQQLGRVLSASMVERPVVLDFVDNTDCYDQDDNLVSGWANTLNEAHEERVRVANALGLDVTVVAIKPQLVSETAVRLSELLRTLRERRDATSSAYYRRYLIVKAYYDQHGKLPLNKAVGNEAELACNALHTEKRRDSIPQAVIALIEALPGWRWEGAKNVRSRNAKIKTIEDVLAIIPEDTIRQQNSVYDLVKFNRGMRRALHGKPGERLRNELMTRFELSQSLTLNWGTVVKSFQWFETNDKAINEMKAAYDAEVVKPGMTLKEIRERVSNKAVKECCVQGVIFADEPLYEKENAKSEKGSAFNSDWTVSRIAMTIAHSKSSRTAVSSIVANCLGQRVGEIRDALPDKLKQSFRQMVSQSAYHQRRVKASNGRDYFHYFQLLDADGNEVK